MEPAALLASGDELRRVVEAWKRRAHVCHADRERKSGETGLIVGAVVHVGELVECLRDVEAADLVDHFRGLVGRVSRLLFSRPDWPSSCAETRDPAPLSQHGDDGWTS